MREIKWGTPSSFVCTALMFVFSILSFISGIVMMNDRSKGRDLCTEKASAEVMNYYEYTEQSVSRKHSSYKVYSPVYRFEYKGRYGHRPFRRVKAVLCRRGGRADVPTRRSV